MNKIFFRFAAGAFKVIIIFWIFGPFFKLFGQTFTKVTDSSNPAATVTTDANYSGAAWVDYNNDGNLDLFTSKTFLFKNIGGGNFEQVESQLGKNNPPGISNGTSWGDFDNDGDIDCHIAGSPSILYVNDGNDIFTPQLTGDISPEIDNRGWTSAWADYNNDSFLDLIITHPRGFVGMPSLPSHFYENNGDNTFTKRTDFNFTQELAPYTVATWYDYDFDGDQDLFIGAGPAGTSPNAPDFLYKNTFIENGTEGFSRLHGALGTDIQNGQVWNFIDYDNDQDLDAFVTNYDGVPDRFYENDGGSYSEINTALSINGSHLANTWGDLDNDGSLDVIITHEGGTIYFRNDNGTFVNTPTGFILSGAARAAVLGDYDNDGDLDLFISGTGNAKGLFRNDTENGNHWINISLSGTVSNRSAIGAIVRVKAIINGNPVWQIREVSAQNSFNGHSSLRVHFGLGDASSIDSMIIKWPSGQEEIRTSINSNQHLQISEEIPAQFLSPSFSADTRIGSGTLKVQFEDKSLFDPNTPITSWEWDFNNDGVADDNSQNPSYTYQDTGVYSVKLTISNGVTSETRLKTNYITVNQNTTDVSDEELLPDKFILMQNYPNPFNPSTTIEFAVPKTSRVTLKIFNLLGIEIAELVNETKQPGFYKVNADLSNLKNGLSSGVYFYQLKADNFLSAQKMILIK